MARKEMLDYVWNSCITPQLGYSFSRNHTMPYSIIALQEMNLAYFYPDIYWNTACLTINASANEDVEDNKSTNYGKIAKAIGDMQTRGVKIALPDINKAKFGFSPDEENNQIIFGLKGINGIGDDVVNHVLQNAPYSSLQDFIDETDIAIKPMVNLIKAGCFDALCKKDRVQIMRDYISKITVAKVTIKKSLSLSNFNAIVELGILPERFEFLKRLFYFKKYTFHKSKAIDCPGALFKNNKPQKNVFLLDQPSQVFYETELMRCFRENADYCYTEEGLCVAKAEFEKWYKLQTQPLKEWINSPDTLKTFNNAQYTQYANEIWDKYCQGSISKWEMDSLSFYHSKHELADVNMGEYNLSNFDTIPEEPVVIEKKETPKGTKEKYQLFKIAGTLLDKNATKHYITLLTTTGVVTVKFYDGAFVHYNKQISSINEETGKKNIVEKSWFTRGNKLLITGIRRGNTFYPKRYYDSIYQHTVCLIEEVNGEDLVLKYEREGKGS